MRQNLRIFFSQTTKWPNRGPYSPGYNDGLNRLFKSNIVLHKAYCGKVLIDIVYETLWIALRGGALNISL